jgi:hypothetical protein
MVRGWVARSARAFVQEARRAIGEPRWQRSWIKKAAPKGAAFSVEHAAPERCPWNAGRVVGAKRALKPQQAWAICFWLHRERRLRDRTLFDLPSESKLGGYDAVKIRIGDLASGGRSGKSKPIQQSDAPCLAFALEVVCPFLLELF